MTTFATTTLSHYHTVEQQRILISIRTAYTFPAEVFQVTEMLARTPIPNCTTPLAPHEAALEKACVDCNDLGVSFLRRGNVHHASVAFKLSAETLYHVATRTAPETSHDRFVTLHAALSILQRQRQYSSPAPVSAAGMDDPYSPPVSRTWNGWESLCEAWALLLRVHEPCPSASHKLSSTATNDSCACLEGYIHLEPILLENEESCATSMPSTLPSSPSPSPANSGVNLHNRFSNNYKAAVILFNMGLAYYESSHVKSSLLQAVGLFETAFYLSPTTLTLHTSASTAFQDPHPKLALENSVDKHYHMVAMKALNNAACLHHTLGHYHLSRLCLDSLALYVLHLPPSVDGAIQNERNSFLLTSVLLREPNIASAA